MRKTGPAQVRYLAECAHGRQPLHRKSVFTPHTPLYIERTPAALVGRRYPGNDGFICFLLGLGCRIKSRAVCRTALLRSTKNVRTHLPHSSALTEHRAFAACGPRFTGKIHGFGGGLLITRVARVCSARVRRSSPVHARAARCAHAARPKARVPDGLGLLVPSCPQRGSGRGARGRQVAHVPRTCQERPRQSVQPRPRPHVHATGHTHTAHAHTEWRRPAPSAAVEWPPPERGWGPVDTRKGAKQVDATATRGPGRCRAKGCTKTCCGRPQGPTTHHHRPGRVLGDRRITSVRK